MFIQAVGFRGGNINIEGRSGRLRMFIQGVGFRGDNINIEGRGGRLRMFIQGVGFRGDINIEGRSGRLRMFMFVGTDSNMKRCAALLHIQCFQPHSTCCFIA